MRNNRQSKIKLLKGLIDGSRKLDEIRNPVHMVWIKNGNDLTPAGESGPVMTEKEFNQCINENSSYKNKSIIVLPRNNRDL